MASLTIYSVHDKIKGWVGGDIKVNRIGKGGMANFVKLYGWKT